MIEYAINGAFRAGMIDGKCNNLLINTVWYNIFDGDTVYGLQSWRLNK